MQDFYFNLKIKFLLKQNYLFFWFFNVKFLFFDIFKIQHLKSFKL